MWKLDWSEWEVIVRRSNKLAFLKEIGNGQSSIWRDNQWGFFIPGKSTSTGGKTPIHTLVIPDCWVVVHCIDKMQFVYSPVGGHLIVFSFWPFQMELLWTLVYKSLCGCMSSFFLSKYLGMEYLDHMVGICLI